MERILLKTTIPYTSDDWNIERFSLLRAHLASLEGAARRARFEADARDRKPDANGDDRDLVGLGESKYTQLWLFAVDVGGGLTARDCEGITAFRRRGGGCMVTRDHQDMGSCVLNLPMLGSAHYFHSKNPETEEARHADDDPHTTTICRFNGLGGLVRKFN